MIDDTRLQHIMGVARKCYSLALDRGHTETYARKMFMLGYLHDIGYEFAENKYQHSDVSAELMSLMNCDAHLIDIIKGHGKYGDYSNEEYIILNTADMLIDSNGNEVDVITRLDDIKSRYGEHSDDYLTACDICYKLRLTSINLANSVI